MKKKNNLRTIFIIITVLNLAFIGGGVYSVFYLKDIKTELTELEKTKKDQETKAGNFFKLKNLIEETKNERMELGSYFIEGETEAVTLLEEIEDISDTLGVPITLNISTEKVSFNEQGQDVLRLTIETKGTFQEMNQLLVLFNNLQYKTVVTGISLRRAEAVVAEGATPLWNMSLGLQVVSFTRK